jgi:glucokinase
MLMRSTVAVDLGATNIRAGIVSREGEILKKISVKTPQEGSGGEVVTNRIIDLVAELLESGIHVGGIGVSSAGPLDLDRGAVSHSPNMAFPEIPISNPLQERFGLPVRLLNDGVAGLLGECWVGCARGYENVVYITFSTGIGGGALVNGLPLAGRGGNAAEIGHFFVDNRYLLKCDCGNTGHWEAYASAKNIPRFFSAWAEQEDITTPGFDTGSAASILSAVSRNLPIARAFQRELGAIIARGLSSVIVAYDPEIIVLDGPIARHHGDVLLDVVRPGLDTYLPLPVILISPLEGNAPMLGAAKLMLDTGT